MNLSVSSATDPGLVRTDNEDALYVDAELGLLAVADGVSGRPRGDVASKLAVAKFAEYVQQHLQDNSASVLDMLADAALFGDMAIRTKGGVDSDYLGMASTLTACLIQGETGHFAHIGDSRAYLMRGGHIEQLTDDHTLSSFRKLEGLDPVPENISEAKNLLAALGLSVQTGADTFARNLEVGDLLVLCTDGFYSVIGDEDLAAIARMDVPLEERLQNYVSLAHERGGPDNITVALGNIDAL